MIINKQLKYFAYLVDKQGEIYFTHESDTNSVISWLFGVFSNLGIAKYNHWWVLSNSSKFINDLALIEVKDIDRNNPLNINQLQIFVNFDIDEAYNNYPRSKRNNTRRKSRRGWGYKAMRGSFAFNRAASGVAADEKELSKEIPIKIKTKQKTYIPTGWDDFARIAQNNWKDKKVKRQWLLHRER